MAPLSSSPGSSPDQGEAAGPCMPPAAPMDPNQLVQQLTELQDAVAGVQRQLTGLLAAIRVAGGGPVLATVDLECPPLYKLVLGDFHRSRSAARGRSARNNVQQAKSHAGRFCWYLLADLTADAAGQDLAFLDRVDKVCGYPAYLRVEGYASTTIQKMVHNIALFLKYVWDSRLRASGLSRTRLSWLVVQIRMAQSRVSRNA
ncbi:uncharacterized protein LOC103130697 [Poecilia formosa]|uniref:uncharacterized protein LOC103130697 n=1 Tax=Poecilia formosa TaxID=48698 RepID=UPI0004443DB6|nr:PREDICTED: uncharacterized protein LOC103130697 [Poecilia formosa]